MKQQSAASLPLFFYVRRQAAVVPPCSRRRHSGAVALYSSAAEKSPNMRALKSKSPISISLADLRLGDHRRRSRLHFEAAAGLPKQHRRDSFPAPSLSLC